MVKVDLPRLSASGLFKGKQKCVLSGCEFGDNLVLVNSSQPKGIQSNQSKKTNSAVLLRWEWR